MTTLFASAVPRTTRVVSAVTPSAAFAPVSALIPVTAGADGADVSTTTANGADNPLTFPAASVAVAAKAYGPSASAVAV